MCIRDSDRIARESVKKEAMLFKLSTRVRGSGKVGQMSTLLNQAFDVVARQAGKTRQAFLIIDEGDSLASTRDTAQSHHEDKVAVNTIIQKVDDLRRHSGRILVFLCTNSCLLYTSDRPCPAYRDRRPWRLRLAALIAGCRAG